MTPDQAAEFRRMVAAHARIVVAYDILCDVWNMTDFEYICRMSDDRIRAAIASITSMEKEMAKVIRGQTTGPDDGE